MKHWLETRQVLDRLAELQAEGRRAALATVVRVRGSTYRRTGAKLLIADDGSTTGNVSGGCLENDVREAGLRVLREGRAELRQYCSGTDEIGAWDLGLGCEGQAEVFVEPALEARPAERDLLARDLPFAVCTLVAEKEEAAPRGRLLVTSDGCEGRLGSRSLEAAVAARVRGLIGGESSDLHEIEDRRVFIDLFVPPPQLLLFGAGEDARPLARLGLEIGFQIVVVDWRPALLDPQRFPGGVRLLQSDANGLAERLPLHEQCYAVLVTHNFAADGWYLRPLVDSPVPYIGILGPRQRTERLLNALEPEGALDRTRIYGPVGLDLGTEGAEQVAFSILSEILTVRSGRSGVSLRDRTRPIHAAVG
jgi:xanthine dehydrogenase accessory factor